MYWEAVSAISELRKRLNSGFQRKVLQFLKEYTGREIELPKLPFDCGILVLARYLATPNFDSIRFVEKASALGLTPVWFTFTGDKFYSRNQYKVRLLKLFFYEGRGRNGGPKGKWLKIFQRNFSWLEGRQLKEIQLDSGLSLVDFHRRLFRIQFPKAIVFDLSEWLVENGLPINKDYMYPILLALAGGCGVLLENFDGVSYSFKAVVEWAVSQLPFAPLIIKGEWVDPGSSSWKEEFYWYPGSLFKYANQFL